VASDDEIVDVVSALVCLVLTDSVAAQIIKPVVGRIRPSHELVDMVRLLVGRGGKYSFPSNHAANSMAFAIVTGFFYPQMRRWLLIIPILVGFSRVYVGVHFPGDPSMPGALQIEAMVQLGALMVTTLPGNKGKVVYLTSANNLKFEDLSFIIPILHPSSHKCL